MRNPTNSLLILILFLIWIAPSVTLASHGGHETGSPDKFLAYLFAGFAVVWAIFFGYGFYLDRLGRELQRQVNELNQRGIREE